jgi:hypothetical protein
MYLNITIILFQEICIGIFVGFIINCIFLFFYRQFRLFIKILHKIK